MVAWRDFSFQEKPPVILTGFFGFLFSFCTSRTIAFPVPLLFFQIKLSFWFVLLEFLRYSKKIVKQYQGRSSGNCEIEGMSTGVEGLSELKAVENCFLWLPFFIHWVSSTIWKKVFLEQTKKTVGILPVLSPPGWSPWRLYGHCSPRSYARSRWWTSEQDLCHTYQEWSLGIL